MDSTDKENKELAASILAGEMKNAWQAEDRPNRTDSRPASMRLIPTPPKTKAYYDRYDNIFRKKGEGMHIKIQNRGKTEQNALDQAMAKHEKEHKNDGDAARAKDYEKGLDGGWNTKGEVYRSNYDRIFKGKPSPKPNPSVSYCCGYRSSFDSYPDAKVTSIEICDKCKESIRERSIQGRRAINGNACGS